MDIPLPPGFGSAVPFDKEKHRRLGLGRHLAAFAGKLNFVYVATAEFPRACHDFPVTFARDASGSIAPIAITGMDAGTNLFVEDNGEWASDSYCPAYVRRYPFFTVTVSPTAGDDEQALICVDENALEAGAPALIDATGEPTDRWREIELLITEMDKEQRVTDQFCTHLDALGLFESFDADFHPKGKPPVSVRGLLRVNERKLLEIGESTQVALLREGHLARIYAHLLSLENFNRLLDRYVRKPA